MNGRTLKKDEIVHGLLGPIVFKHFIRATIWLDALHKLGRRLIEFAWLRMMDDEKGFAEGLLTLPIRRLFDFSATWWLYQFIFSGLR